MQRQGGDAPGDAHRPLRTLDRRHRLNLTPVCYGWDILEAGR